MMRNVDGVETVEHRIESSGAECLICRWQISEWDGRSAKAVRQASHRHVAKTGHQVDARSEHHYVYGPQLEEGKI